MHGAMASVLVCLKGLQAKVIETRSNPSHFVSAAAPQVDMEPSLLDILDHVLNAGVVLHGSIVISLAGVDLVYLGLNAVLTSVETALKHINAGQKP